MKTSKDLSLANFKLKALVIGGSGSGKTHFSLTCPKCAIAVTEPSGLDTAIVNPSLRDNIVVWEDFIPKSLKDTERVFSDLSKWLAEVRIMVSKGEVETVIIDNFTYFVDNMFLYMQEFQMPLTKGGEDNKLALYADLGNKLYTFILMELLTIPSNLIVTCHERSETDEALKKKTDKTNTVVANIVSGFRDKIDGLFSLVLYLNKIPKGDNKYEYWGRVNKGNNRNGKNRFNLKELISNISYQSIITEISNAVKIK